MTDNTTEGITVEPSLPVWVVDDDDVRLSLRFALATHNFNAMTFASGEEFLEQVDIMQPGCAVLDLTMRGLNGMDVQNRLRESNSPISVILLTGNGTIRQAVQAMENGAISFMEKPVDPDELAKKVAFALEHSSRTWRFTKIRALLDTFSRREAQIFELICQGYKTTEIAAKLFLSARTVDVHRSHIIQKLGGQTPIGLLYDLARCTTTGDLLAGKQKK